MSTPFMTVKEACNTTGLSMFYLRQGVKEGWCPHIRSGNKILINVPLLLDRLNKESVAAEKEVRS